MKIAFYLEGTSDEEALRIFVRRILNRHIEVLQVFPYQGVSNMHERFPLVAKRASDLNADAIILVRDNDDNKITHNASHNQTPDRACYYCQLHSKFPKLPARQNGQLKCAIGVAVEAMESWLLYGAHHAGRTSDPNPEKVEKNRLKQMLYGSSNPSPGKRKKIIVPIAEQTDLTQLRTACPSFDFFAKNVEAL